MRRHGSTPRLLRVPNREDREAGFTLIEMIITTALLPIIVGAIVVSLDSVLSTQVSVSKNTADSADAQVISAYFNQDVASATSVTTSSSAAQCGTGTQLLGLQFTYNNATGKQQSFVSYSISQTANTYSLFRQYCDSGPSVTPTQSLRVSSDLPASQPPPLVTPAAKNTAAQSGWTSTYGVTGVTLAVTEPGSNYSFSLTSIPNDSTSVSSLSNIITPTTGCGFASAGTGTYAAKLCFVDFGSWSSSAPPNGCHNDPSATTISAGITNTPYTLSFCVTTTGAPTYTCQFPTYGPAGTNACATSGGGSQAFLGNSGFYMNVPGHPAIYQTESARSLTSTVTLTNIQLADYNGHPASSWYLVSGDAESTDTNESITWQSDRAFSLLPNYPPPASPIGNACANANGIGSTLTFSTDAKTVSCTGTVSSNKTGTVMLEALAPTSLSVTLVGGGLQGFFVGVHLP